MVGPTMLSLQERYLWSWKACWSHLGILEEPTSSELRHSGTRNPFKTGGPNQSLRKRAASLQQSNQQAQVTCFRLSRGHVWHTLENETEYSRSHEEWEMMLLPFNHSFLPLLSFLCLLNHFHVCSTVIYSTVCVLQPSPPSGSKTFFPLLHQTAAPFAWLFLRRCDQMPIRPDEDTD